MGPVQAIEMSGLEKFQPQFAMLPPPESAPPVSNPASNPFAGQSNNLQPPGLNLNPSPVSTPRSSRVSHAPPEKKANGLYDFNGQDPSELSFATGEELVIVQDIGGGWLKAKNRYGKEGLIPGNYVQIF